MPELTEAELRILTRPRLAPWVGLVIMALNAFLVVMCSLGPMHFTNVFARYWAMLMWGGMFLVGLVAFLLASKWELERARVMGSLRGGQG